MEHLIIASDGHLTEQDMVPYVATEEYRTRTLSDWLTVDWPTKQKDMLHMSIEEANSLLQTWFFFGLFRQVLGDFFVDTDYITQRAAEDGSLQMMLTTAKLTSCLELWIKDASRKRRRDDCVPLYRAIFSEFSTYQYFTARYRLMMNSLYRPVGISMETCVGLLSSAVLKVFGAESGLPKLAFSFINMPSIDLTIMRDNGWCPSIATRAWGKFNLAEQMMIRTAPNPASTPQDHTRCSAHSSRCMQTDEANFVALHAEPGCECDNWSVDGLALDRMIESDVLPVLQFTLPALARLRRGTPTAFEEFALKLVPKADSVSYIAISHVWAHGLGNPRANALPRCQLSRLLRKIALFVHCSTTMQHGGKVHFWLDSLCCPAQPCPTKFMTLSKMREIYTNPSDVLVLDKCLESLESANRPAYELAMYILMCTWAQRAWTLQEAALPKRLWFCFLDSFKTSDWLLSELFDMRASVSIAEAEVLLNFHEYLHIMTGGMRAEERYPSLAWSPWRIGHALAHRSLTVASDEPLILQNLIDTYGITTAATESVSKHNSRPSFWSRLSESLAPSRTIGRVPGVRSKHRRVIAANAPPQADKDASMAAFWDTCRRKRLLDDQMIFNSLPRLSAAGYRWAPESLLYDNHRQDARVAMGGMLFRPSTSPPTQEDHDPRGLVVALSGFTMATPSSVTVMRQIKRHVSADDAISRRISLRHESTGHWYTVTPLRELSRRAAEGDEPSGARDSRFVLIMDRERGLLASVVDAGVFPQSGTRFHHVHGEYQCLVERYEPPNEQLWEELLVTPVTDREGVPKRVFDMGVAALTALNVQQHKIEENKGDNVRAYITALSRRLLNGQYLLATQSFSGEQGHKWIVD